MRVAVYACLLTTLAVFPGHGATPEFQPDPTIEPHIRALFDQPVNFIRTVLPPRPNDPNPRGVVRCYYYPDFTVKELDYGDHGDTAISVTPMPAGAVRPPCGKQNDRSEIVLPGGEAGYLVGVKGIFVFVVSTMGMNTTPFSIYAGRTGKTLYSDETSDDSPKRLAIEAGVLTMTYPHGAQAGCSILTDGQACWAQFARKARLPQAIARLPPPVAACEAGYANSSIRPTRNAASVIFYDVTMTLDSKGQAKVLTRGAITCDPEG